MAIGICEGSALHRGLKTTVPVGVKALSTIVGIGTATTPRVYSQEELLDIFHVNDRKTRSLFLNSAIERRHLVLPSPQGLELPPDETQEELLNKHRTWAIRIGSSAIQDCLRACGADLADISYLCCTTTTGFLTPSLSALISRELSLAEDCARLDVVGMGCNAGLNSLNVTSAWTLANPGKLAILLCVEICSAGYVFDGTMRSAVVNSLFGDGAAAAAVKALGERHSLTSPSLLGFKSCLITDAMDAMRFDWDEHHRKFNFFLDPGIPYVIGANIERTIDSLLSKYGLRRGEIRHWLVHSGGKKVIDSVKVNLGLSNYDLRHTLSVLRDYGNLSSGSFLYSYKMLVEEGFAVAGDYCVMITMGPGSTIESALLQW